MLMKSLFINFPQPLFLLLIWKAIGGQITEEIKEFFGPNLTRCLPQDLWYLNANNFLIYAADHITQFLPRAVLLETLYGIYI